MQQWKIVVPLIQWRSTAFVSMLSHFLIVKFIFVWQILIENAKPINRAENGKPKSTNRKFSIKEIYTKIGIVFPISQLRTYWIQVNWRKNNVTRKIIWSSQINKMLNFCIQISQLYTSLILKERKREFTQNSKVSSINWYRTH